MRFATRTFLWSFVPFALLLTGTFWVIQTKVVSTVRAGLRSSLREKQVSISQMRSKSELQNSRFLRIVGESAALKAGVQLVLADPKSGDARLTVEDQLREICEMLKFDFLLVSNLDGHALAGVMRMGDQLLAMDVAHTPPPQRGFFTVGGRTYQVTSIPVDQADEHVATLSVGEHFDFSELNTPAVLAHHGKILMSNIPGVSLAEVESALRACPDQAECEMRLHDEAYLSLPMESIYFGDGYLLRSLQSVDSASAPVQSILRSVFVFAGVGALLGMLILSVLSSRSIVGPISNVVAHLRESQRTGVLPEFPKQRVQTLEIRALTESFNEAAAAIREGRDRLYRAYVEFVGSLASALDARDRYTAGHSHRVSEFSCAIAIAMNISGQELEEIRIGALLHDIGKIGIADSVLQKPGRLTNEEFALIQQHPTIGRRILEGVHGFEAYLPVVELHHENWDGSGYPLGQRGEATPLSARIVHVADVYDAITSDRPYRLGMSHGDAIRIIEECAGSQFDPAVIEAFKQLPRIRERRHLPVYAEEMGLGSIRQLADAVSRESTPSVGVRVESEDV
jgi:HD-GYP domain-containing protein (c-di-GMP phosphodiesterase class II)